jgi:hypothetical protein
MSYKEATQSAQTPPAHSDVTLIHPPKARLAFRVGVVGHRPNRLANASEEELRALLRSLLQQIKETVQRFPHSEASHQDLYLSEAPVFRAVSPLAEGTDRIFAEVALDLGFELCCPMPFVQSEFEEDFKPPQTVDPQSLDRFRHLLSRAAAESRLVKFELDGSRSEPGAAYAAAGRVVLNQSDLLVAVWDGQAADGMGGTVQTLQEALAYQIPVVWVDAWAPHPWQLLRSVRDLERLSAGQRCVPAPDSSRAFGGLCDVIVEILAPRPEPKPRSHSSRRSSGLYETYFQERRPRFNLFILWKLFRDLVGANRLSIPAVRVPDFEKAVAPDWPTDGSGVTRWVNSRLRGHYAWADKLADLHADAYRSSFLLAYGLGVLAVVLALLPLVLPEEGPGEAVSIGAEFVVILTIIALIVLGNRRRRHQRWMDYRLVAELVRQLKLLLPLGGGRPFPRLPAHLRVYGNPPETWMYWHVRSIERDLGLPEAVITIEYLRDCLRSVLQVVEGQWVFHRDNRIRAGRIEGRLHGTALALFALTAVAVCVHLVPLLPGAARWGLDSITGFSRYLTIACAVLPALGGALTAVNNQGEFARIAKRSEAMEARLERIHRELTQGLASDALRSTELIDTATRVARLMVDEVLDWRVVFQDRPLVPPA